MSSEVQTTIDVSTFSFVLLSENRPDLSRIPEFVFARFFSSGYGNGGKEGRKEMFYLTTHSTHFIYGYMVLDIWKWKCSI